MSREPADATTNQRDSPRHHSNEPQGDRGELARPSLYGGRRLWLTCILLVAATLATGAEMVWQLRQNALTNSQRELTNLGTVLAEQTSRTIQSVDLVLREVQSRTSALALRSAGEFRARLAGEDTHRFLVDHLRNLPQAAMINLIDANGALLNSSESWPVPGLDVPDRDYFRHLSEHDDPEAFISIATKGRLTGKWVIFIARRVDGPDGAFLGLVTGSIDTQYLADFYKTISLVPGESVALLRRDGTVIAGYPDMEDRRDTRVPAQSPWYDRVAQGGGFYHSPGDLSDSPSIVTVHPLRDYPLVVDANVSERAALRDWRAEAIAIMAAAAGVGLGLTVLFAVIIALFRSQQRQNAELSHGRAELRANERKLKAFAQMSADWFWEQDSDLRFTVDSKISFASRPTDVGKTRWDLGDPAMNPRRWDSHKADLAARRPFRDFRWERIGLDGKRHHMSTSGDPIFDTAGTFVGYHGTGRDRTADVEAAEELGQAKDQAEAANRSKSEFLANMSHELRTPLHAIIGFSELIRDQSAGPINRDYVAWADDILNGGRHLLDVINDVLELSRIEAGRYEISDDKVDLSAIASACRAMLRLQAEVNQVSIDCAPALTGAALTADRRAVKQIMLNLLTNAVKFTPPGGAVSIGTEPTTDGGIALVVADTGIGIEPSALTSLCEPFIQADTSISRTYGGTGLGLAISRKLAALHGGVLTMESVPGRGTTVRVTFPAERVIAKRADADAPAGMLV